MQKKNAFMINSCLLHKSKDVEQFNVKTKCIERVKYLADFNRI